jgi:hypothetical protein
LDGTLDRGESPAIGFKTLESALVIIIGVDLTWEELVFDSSSNLGASNKLGGKSTAFNTRKLLESAQPGRR